MADSTLTDRLRELAEHRAKILGKSPEDMEEWQAAEEIEELRKPNIDQRWYIGFDQSSHRYLIKLKDRNAWDEWCAIDPDDERAWEVPDEITAIRIDGAFVHFFFPTVVS